MANRLLRMTFQLTFLIYRCQISFTLRVKVLRHKLIISHLIRSPNIIKYILLLTSTV